MTSVLKTNKIWVAIFWKDNLTRLLHPLRSSLHQIKISLHYSIIRAYNKYIYAYICIWKVKVKSPASSTSYAFFHYSPQYKMLEQKKILKNLAAVSVFGSSSRSRDLLDDKHLIHPLETMNLHNKHHQNPASVSDRRRHWPKCWSMWKT